MKDIKIFKPEVKSFAVTVQFASEATYQSSSMMIDKLIKYFISLNTLFPEDCEDYIKCISILRCAAFCAGTAASLSRTSDCNEKKIEMTIYFETLDNLTKFVDTLEENIRL